MTSRLLSVLLAVAALASAACDRDAARPACFDMTMPGVVIPFPPIHVTVRDAAGRGIAYGATVVARSATDSALAVGNDTTEVWAGAQRAGTFSLRVSKPFYVDSVVPNVAVHADECGLMAATSVEVRLRLAPGAPPVRSLALLGPNYLSIPGEHLALVPWLDADPGIDPAVRWRLSDTTVATIDASGVVTARCTTAGAVDTVTAISAADTTVRAKRPVGIMMQSHCP